MTCMQFTASPECLPGINHARPMGSAMGRAIAQFWLTAGAKLVLLALAVLATLIAAASPALAQQSFTYINTTNGAIGGGTPCTNPLVRTYAVPAGNNITIGDVDIGLRGSHAWRGDLRATLQHPDGTRVQVVTGNGNVSGDNFNFRLNDGGTQLVNTDGNNATHQTGAVNGGFQHNFIPNNPLSAFNGKQSQGTWRLEMCDIFTGADDGTFFHSELYITEQVANFADLSLTQTASTTTPAYDSNVTFTLSLNNSNASNQTATATVLYQLPRGLTFQSASGNGSYNATTGIWTPSNIAPGQSRQIQIVARMRVGPTEALTATAQVQTSNRADTDSTPGNGLAGEDDQSSVTVTTSGSRTAGTPPTLVCPADAVTFDWTGRTWNDGDTDRTYTLAGVNTIRWQLSNPATWLNIAGIGGQQPALTNGVQDGTTVLSKGIGFDSSTQNATTTITLGDVVDGLQLRVIDVDYAEGVFADRITVTGTRAGGTVTVLPVLTAGTANYVIGNTAYGDVESPATSNAADVYVTFDEPVDTVVLEYGSNVELAPDDPVTQAIQMAGSISICAISAQLSVTKVSSVLDDGVAGPGEEFNLPGALLRYCILVTNTGSGTATEITASDPLPVTTTYTAGSMRSGTTCANATTVEDDDSDDAAETDGLTAAFAAGTLTFGMSTLPGGATRAVTFTATIE